MQSLIYCLDFKSFYSHWNGIIHDLKIDPMSAALNCFTHLQEAIAILLSVYLRWILTFGDCFTDLSLILAFVCKNCATLADFQSADGSARWQTSFNFNHTPHAGTLPSTGHCRPTAQLLLSLPCVPGEETFCSSSKSHTDRAATRNWPITLSQQYLELITD